MIEDKAHGKPPENHNEMPHGHAPAAKLKMFEKGKGEKLEFTPERLERFHKLVAKYEAKPSALLPALYIAQEQWGYLTEENMTYVANLLGMAPRSVFEVASFYFMFKKKDMGRYCLQVCNNITCTMMGSEGLIQVIQDDLGISAGEVTADKMFSYQPVQCLGSCDTAPVVSVNDDYVENLTPETFRKLIQGLKNGEKVLP